MKITFPVRIYLVALILRLIPVLLARGLGIGLDDMFQYDMLARSLASGNGYRWYAQEDLKLLAPYVDFDMATANGYDPGHGLYTSFRAPLYPAFLAMVYFLSGTGFSRFFVARLTQAIIFGAPLAPLTYNVAVLFSFGEMNEHIAKISAWIVACYPTLLVYPLGLGTENPFFLLLLCSFLFLLRSINKPIPFHFLLSGIFLALTALTRSVILPFAGMAILYLIFLHRKKALLAGIAFILVIAPWIIRNSLLHGKLTGIETSMGYNLYLGYYPTGNGSFIFGPSLDLLTIMDDSERDSIGTQKAFEFIEEQPGRFIPLAFIRLGYFFGLEKRVLMYFYSNNLVGFLPRPILLLAVGVLLLPFVIISIFAALGLSFLKWNSQTILLLLLFLLYLLPHILILAEDRFHLALIPFMAILASLFWYIGPSGIIAPWQASNLGKPIVVCTVLCACLLIINWGMELDRDADKISVLFGPAGNQSNYPY